MVRRSISFPLGNWRGPACGYLGVSSTLAYRIPVVRKRRWHLEASFCMEQALGEDWIFLFPSLSY